MVLWCPSAFLFFIAFIYVSSVTAERRLLCSSEHLSIWYTFDGPLYYLSLAMSPCSVGVSLYNITYTIIPMFTITRVGFQGTVHYKDQLWLEHVVPDVDCEDCKICYIIKGETLHETFPFYVKKLHGPEGEYQIDLTLNIIDDHQKKMTLQFNVTADLKNDGKKNSFFPQIGGP